MFKSGGLCEAVTFQSIGTSINLNCRATIKFDRPAMLGSQNLKENDFDSALIRIHFDDFLNGIEPETYDLITLENGDVWEVFKITKQSSTYLLTCKTNQRVPAYGR